MKRLLPHAAALVLIALAPPSLARAQATEKVRYERHRISFEELSTKASDAKTAYDIVKRLRPQFLQARGSGSMRSRTPVPIKVFVDGAFRGGVAMLNEVVAHSVVEIKYLNGPDATTRFGTGHESGAILVTTGRR
jgi:NaMN:DMB phosphoribosyltransferase